MRDHKKPATRSKVLMVSFAFFPRPGAGHVRTQKFAKYLPEFGWDPSVLTERFTGELADKKAALREMDGAGIIEAPFNDPFLAMKELLGLDRHRDAIAQVDEGDMGSLSSRVRADVLKRVIRLAKDWLAFPDTKITWVPAAVRAGYSELRQGGYSLIYSTHPPGTNHIVASVLQRLTGLPWIADYRDLWSQDEFLDRSPARRRAERQLEKAVVRRACHLVTVGAPYAETLRELHRGKPVSVITNGFDPDDHMSEVQPACEKFIITYTGALYGMRCDPRPVLSAVESLIDRGEVDEEEVVIRLYSQWDPALNGLRDTLKYKRIIEVNGMVPREEAITRQKESTALLAVHFDEPQAAFCHSSKIFEYMGSGRPVLLWAPRGGIASEVLEETQAGLSASTAEELEAVLLEWFREFRKTGRIGYRPLKDEVGRYSRRELTRELAGIMNGAIDRYAR